MKMSKPTGKRVVFYNDVAGKVRWTQYAENGKIRHASEQGFANFGIAWDNWTEGWEEARDIREQALAYFKNGPADFDRVELDT